MEEIKLTVAVPTYNRAGKLKKCLELLLLQKGIEQVEILVSDNASTDGTEAFMKEFIQTHPQIQYYRNEKNLGPDKNFLNCYERARGKYVYLLSDDDILLPDSLVHILSAADEDPVFMHLNSCTLLDEDNVICTPARYKDEGVVFFSNRDDFFAKVGIRITFLSALVIKKSLFELIEDKEKYIGSYFLQSYLAMQTLAHEGRYALVTQNCVAASPNEVVRYDLYYVWFKCLHALFIEEIAQSRISLPVAKKVYKKEMRKTVENFVISFRLRCDDEKEWEKRYALDVLKKYPTLFLPFVILIYSPKFVLKMVNRMKLCIRFVKQKVKGFLK